MLRKSHPWIALGCLALLTAAGCDNQSPTSTVTDGSDAVSGEGEASEVSDLSGTINIDGSSTVYPISLQVAEEFGKDFPNVEVTVGLSGTGGGFKKFMAGSTDISDASRPVKGSEIALGKENNIEFIELPVAYDGLSIVVNPANDFVDQLTVDQLKKIFLVDQAAKTWQEVNPEWPEEEIKLFIPGTDSGTFDYFKEVVAGKEGTIRGDEAVSTDENDNNLVAGVEKNEFALGFFGAAYYFSNKDRVKVVPIVNPEGEAVAPTPVTIENGSYAPFGRPLFIYISKSSSDKIEVGAFVDYYLENVPRVAAEVGYVALPEAVYAEGRKRYDDTMTGTHFLDAEGNKREGSLPEIYIEANLTE